MTGLMVKIKSIWGLVLDFGLHSSAMQSRPLVFLHLLAESTKEWSLNSYRCIPIYKPTNLSAKLGTLMKLFAKSIIRFAAQLIVPPFFWLSRWYRSNRDKFFHRMSPSYISVPLVIFGEVLRESRAAFVREFAEYALPRYTVFTEDHYSAGGYGYRGLEKIGSAA